MVLYCNDSIRVLASSDDTDGQSDFQTISDTSSETLGEESSEIREETSEELSETEESSQPLRGREEINSQGILSTSEVGNSGKETSSVLEYVEHIDRTQNSFLGLFVATLVVIGIGLIIRFIWGLLNK